MKRDEHGALLRSQLDAALMDWWDDDDQHTCRPRPSEGAFLELCERYGLTVGFITPGDLREAAFRYRAAEWATRIHEDDDRLAPEHNARVEEWRAADAALADLLGESSPFASGPDE